MSRESRNQFMSTTKVSVATLHSPLGLNCQKFIMQTIEKTWHLTDKLMYVLRYIGGTADESTHFLYYEAVFSQPTVSYPIPQAMASVFFRVADRHTEFKQAVEMTFRMEGEATDHDVRHVNLTDVWILAIIKMKIKLFKRIEELSYM